MLHLLLGLTVIVGGYYMIRYYLIRHALREADKNLRDIRDDISQNRILHLPIPDRSMETLMEAVNSVLTEVRKERLSYEMREKEFQVQIANISHDLRTPLTVILGYLRMMKDPLIIQDTHEQDINEQDILDIQDILVILERKAMSMEKLVSQFYSFSRFYAEDYELQMQEVDICRLIRETLTDHYQVLNEAHLTVDTDLTAYPVWVKGDIEALERIFANLYQNAGRYAKSFLHIEIILDLEKINIPDMEKGEKNIAVLLTNDTEPMTEYDVEHLFDRFYRQDNSRRSDSTGLGLTVARHLAETMLGDLKAHLIPAEYGTSLCFTLLLQGTSAPL